MRRMWGIRRLLVLWLTLSLLFGVGGSALADDYGAREDSVDMEIVLQEDGSAQIKESWTVDFYGDYTFTRYWRSYLPSEQYWMDNWSVEVDGVPWVQLDVPDEDRPDGTFAVETNEQGNTIHIYHDSRETRRVIAISYTVYHGVILYDDVAEFRWNLSGQEEVSTIGEMRAKVYIPEGAAQEDFRIWAHGPLNGLFEKDSGREATLSVTSVPTSEPVDIRLVMPLTLFTGGYYEQGEGLPGILEQEQQLADEANARREAIEADRRAHPIRTFFTDLGQEMEGLATLLLVVGVLGVFGCFILYPFLRIRRLRKKLRRLTPRSAPEYYRFLPDTRPPAVIEKLYHFYPSQKSDRGAEFTATLMDMSLKGHIAIHGTDKNVTLALKESDTLRLPHEDAIYRMIEAAIEEKGSPLPVQELQKYIKKHPEQGIAYRGEFEDAVDNAFDALEWKRTEKLKKSMGILPQLIIPAVLTVVIGIPYGYFVMAEDAFIGPIIVAVGGLGILVGNRIRSLELLTQEGEDQLALWQAFGRFLDDFTTFEEKELPDFQVWRQYLVYAVALGKSKAVMKSLSLKYPAYQLEEDDTYFTSLYYMHRFDERMFAALDSVQHETYRASVDSDSSGGGGGFSSSSGGSGSGSGGSGAD